MSLYEIAARAVNEATEARLMSHAEMVRVVVDAVEPIIRADERERAMARLREQIASEIEAEMRRFKRATGATDADFGCAVFRDAARVARANT